MSELFEKQKQLQEEQFAFEETTEQKNLFEKPQNRNLIEIKEKIKQGFSLADKFENASKREVIMAQIDQKERVKTETVMKKKGFFSKAQAETVTYYQAEEQQVKNRQEDADSLKAYQDLRNDTLADYRLSLSFDAKVACGYDTMKNLSQFANICDEETMKKYGKAPDTPEREADRAEVMDKITAKIMDMDVNAYSNLSDKAICRNAGALEEMSAQVNAFRSLLSQNPAYAEKLKNTKLSDGSSQLDQLNAQMEMLGAISDYYRVRKMILTDSEYINSTKGISHDISDSDPASTVHLKEMLRMSYHLANRVNAVLGGGGDMPELKAGETVRAKKVYGDIDNDIRAQIAKMEQKNLSSNSFKSRDEEKLSFEHKAKEPMSKYVAIYALGSANTMGYVLDDHFREHETKAPELFADYVEKNFKVDEKGVKSDSFNPRFDEAKTYTGMSKFECMDNLGRMRRKIAVMGQMAGLSDKEMLEWYAGLSVRQTNEFVEAKKQASEEKMAYMEEMAADAYMKSLIYHNALLERLAETIGQDAFLMHPEDLAARLTDEQWLLLTSAATISNIITKDEENNQGVRDFVKQYQEKHPDMAPFDVDKFVKAGNAYTALQFKLQTNTTLVKYLTSSDPEDFDDEDVSYEDYQKTYGNDFNWDEIEEWYEQNKDDPQYDYVSSTDLKEEVKKFTLYCMAHPEKLDAKKHVKVMNNQGMDFNCRLTSADAETRDIVAMASEGLVKPRSIKELKKYEAGLKKRGKSSTNIYMKDNEKGGTDYLANEYDPYKMKLHYEMIVAYVDGKEKRGEPVTDEEKMERQEAKALYDIINAQDMAQAEELKKWNEHLKKKKEEKAKK